MSSSRRGLEKLMQARPGKAFNHDQFRVAFEDFYNFRLKPEEFSEEELQALRDLFNVVVWYSPLPDERQKISHYRDDEDVERAWEKARSVLRFPRVDYLGVFGMATPAEAAAIWKLRLVEPSQFPSIAEALLVNSYDVPALRRLAAEEPDSLADLGRLFDQALVALGSERFEDGRAAGWLVRKIAYRIAMKAIEPFQGAKAIWMISLAEGVGSLGEARPFIDAAIGWEERPQDTEIFAEAIVQAARALASKEP